MGCRTRHIAEQDRPHSSDATAATLAGRQDGVVRVDQLRGLGLSKDEITVRIARGSLHRLYRGVYAVGHMALTRRSHERAAVYACGPGAALSHQSAGAAWGLIRSGGPIHVSAPRARVGQDGFVLHRTRRFLAEDVVVLDGIPVTTLHRTLVDLADVLTEKKLADAVHEAEVRRSFDLRQLRAAQARVSGRRGRHRLDRVLRAYTEPPFTRTEAEKRLRSLCEEFNVPMPASNATRVGRELDAFWPKASLAVEVDGRATHGTTRAFYEDRARDRELAVHGIQVLRVTWPDVTDGREALARELRALLRPDGSRR